MGRILIFLLLSGLLSADSGYKQTDSWQRQLNFGRLHGNSATFSLQTTPGVHELAPLPLRYNLSYKGFAELGGSFAPLPYEGTRVILKTLNYAGGGIGPLAGFQYFSGYRWFWIKGNGMLLTPVEGGFYDISAQTLPSKISVSFERNIFTFSWQNPVAENYGTKVVFEETVYNNSPLVNASNATLVYSGHDEQTNMIYHPKPGMYLNIGFFGMYELLGMQIDSGSGIQYWKNDAGVYEPIGGVHQANPDKLREKISLQVPIIDSLSAKIFKVIPLSAPLPLSVSTPGCNVSTPPAHCYHAWPKADEHFQIFGRGWNSLEHQVLMDGLVLPNSGTAYESRVMEWKDRYIRVSLPQTLLSTTTPCVDHVYQVVSRNYPGLDSNEVKVRVANANFYYAQNCGK